MTLGEHSLVRADSGNVRLSAQGSDRVGGSVSATSYTDGKSTLTGSVAYSTPDIKTVIKGTVISGSTADDEPLLGFDPFAGTVDYASDSIDFGQAHNFRTGEAVVYSVGSGGGAIDGLEDGQTYYLIADAATPSQVQFASSRANATSGIAVDLLADPALVTGGLAIPFATVLGDSDEISLGFDHGLADGTALVYNAVAGKAVQGLVDGSTYFVLNGEDPTRLQLTDADGAVVDMNIVPTFEVIKVSPDSTAQVGQILEVTFLDPETHVVKFNEVHGLSPGDTVAYRGALGGDALGRRRQPHR